MNNYNQIGDKIQWVRKLLNYNQGQIADAIGVEVATISKYEKAQRKIKITDIERIAAALYVSSEFLLNGTINRRTMQISEHIRLNPETLPIPVVADKLCVPQRFIQEIVNGSLSPSFEFAERFYATFKLPNPEKAVPDIRFSRERPPDDLETLRLENARLQGNLDSERRLNEALQIKVDELIRENERLKKGGL